MGHFLRAFVGARFIYPDPVASASKQAVSRKDRQIPVATKVEAAKTGVDPARQFLRHAIATVAYRGGKTLRDSPEPFAAFRGGDTTRAPAEILAHMGDLFDWALSQARGKETWHDSEPLAWHSEVDRFFAALKKFDDYLASDAPLHISAEKLFQGAIADALTHVGQLAMLRRLAGAPIRGENYCKAEIVAGRCGADQADPNREFA